MTKKIKLSPLEKELKDALEVALYDLEKLNRFDPLYVPRCKIKAYKVLAKCGVTQLMAPMNDFPRASFLEVYQALKRMAEAYDVGQDAGPNSAIQHCRTVLKRMVGDA